VTAKLSLSVLPRFTTSEPNGPVAPTPTDWTVRVDACASTGAATQNSFQFKPSPPLPSGPTSCAVNVKLDASKQTTFSASVTVTGWGANGTTVTSSTSASINYHGDYLIASLGDSIASGEGNPDVPSATNPVWANLQCHRSVLNAAPAVVARTVENSDPTTTVSFVHFACSGASIDTGLLGRYQGEDSCCTNTPLPPQIDQLRALTCNDADCSSQRRIDALIISIGANDVHFADIATHCALPDTDCTSDGTAAKFSQYLANLDAAYDRLGNAIAQKLNVAPENVYLTEYPDPTTDANCGWSAFPDLLSGISAAEAEWASQTIVAGLNAEARRAAARWGWTFVDGIASKFRCHGVSAGQSRMINTGTDSLTVEAGPDGMLHPNYAGHQAIAQVILNALARPLGSVGTTQHVAYATADGHVHMLRFFTTAGRWVDEDLTAATGAPATAQKGPLTSWVDATYEHIAYLSTGGDIDEMYYRLGVGPWREDDVTTAADAPPALAGSITSWVDSAYEHIAYVGIDSDVHELYFALNSSGPWGQGDLSQLTGAPAVRGGLTSWLDNGYQHIGYIASLDGHVHELSYALGRGPWTQSDATPNGIQPAATSTLTSWIDGPTEHLAFVSADGHIRVLDRLSGVGSWAASDATPNGPGAPVTVHAPLTSWSDSSFQHVVYLTADGHLHELYRPRGASSWSAGDLTAATGATPAQFGALTSWNDGSAQHVVYETTDAHLTELKYPIGQGPWTTTDLTAATGAPATQPSAGLTSWFTR
jgi:hypothetical protein